MAYFGSTPPFGYCTAFHPVLFFLNPNLREFVGTATTLLGRLDLIILSYFISAVLFLPVLIIFLIIKTIFLKRLSSNGKIIIWSLILIVIWAIYYLRSSAGPYGLGADPLELWGNRIYPIWRI